MFTTLILFLFACSSASSTIEAGAAAQAALLARMAETVDTIRPIDPTTAAEADGLIATFRDHFAPLVFTESRSQMEILGIAPCRVPEVPCFGFAVPHHTATDRNIGGWMDRATTLFVSDVLPADDMMAPFVTLHELQHALQYQRGDPPDPLPRICGERWTREREATEFEIRLERAASNGRFDQVINDLVAQEHARTLRVLTFGNVEYPVLDGKAAEIMPGISPIGADLLNVSIIYAFNLALMTNTSDEMRERTISTLQIGLAEPNINALYHH